MQKLLPALLLILSLAATALPGAPVAADLRVERPDATTVDTEAATRRYLENQALLLMIRATFDVVERDAIGDVLKATARQLSDRGPSADDMHELNRTLLSEASYYIVSLRYVTLVGGAAWPGDRPESSYANDALVLLDGLERDLGAAIDSDADPLPILLRLQQLWLLSEGLKDVPPERDMFAGRDALVDAALAALDTRASS